MALESTVEHPAGSSVPEEPSARPRLSRMALLSVLLLPVLWVAQFPALNLLGTGLGVLEDPNDIWIRGQKVLQLTLVLAGYAWPLGTAGMGAVALRRIARGAGRGAGRSLAIFGIALGILAVPVNLVALPNALFPTALTSKYSRTLAYTKEAVRQAIQYGKDKGAYPTSLRLLRESGYCNVPDKDLWDTEFVLSPTLTTGAAPKPGDHVYVYSRGRCKTGTYTPGQTGRTGECAAGGWSSIHGAFSSWQVKPTP